MPTRRVVSERLDQLRPELAASASFSATERERLERMIADGLGHVDLEHGAVRAHLRVGHEFAHAVDRRERRTEMARALDQHRRAPLRELDLEQRVERDAVREPRQQAIEARVALEVAAIERAAD